MSVPPNLRPNRIRFLNSNFVAVGFALGANSLGVSYSSNGTDWVNKFITIESFTHLFGVAYGNGRYVVAGRTNNVEGPGGSIFSSPDLDTWSKTFLHRLFSPVDVAFGNDRFVVVGQATTTSVPTVYVSSDGINWAPTAIVRTNFTSIAFGNGRFVALTSRGFFISTNGVSWSQSFWPNYAPGALAYGNGFYMAAGSATPHSGHYIGWSTNVSPWRIAFLNDYGLGQNTRLFDITFGGGSFVAVGSPSAILQSGNVIVPRIETIMQLPGNQFSFDVSGEFRREHRLQVSPDMAAWGDLLTYTNHLPTVRIELPVDEDTSDQSRFFRAIAK